MEEKIQAGEIKDFQISIGHGLQGRLGEKKVWGGNTAYILGEKNKTEDGTGKKEEIITLANRLAEQGKTPLFFKEEEKFLNLHKRNERIATFVEIVAFDKKAIILAHNVGKGSRLAVEGKIRTSNYVSETGEKRYKVDIILSEFTFIDSKKKVVNEVINEEVPF